MMTQQQHQSSPVPQNQALNNHLNSSSSPSAPSSSPLHSSYSGYLSFPHHRVVAFRPDRKCILESDAGHRTVVQVSMALVLIGAHPNLSFLPNNGRPLAVNPDEPITCRRNPLEADPYTFEVVSAEGPGLYAMGPLVGENFVRFLKGGALAIASDLARRRREEREGGRAYSAADRLVDKWADGLKDRQADGQTETEVRVLDS